MLRNISKVLEEVSIIKIYWLIYIIYYWLGGLLPNLLFIFRGTEFKEDDAIWKGGEDGGVGGGGPPPAGMGAAGPTGGYVAK